MYGARLDMNVPVGGKVSPMGIGGILPIDDESKCRSRSGGV